MRKLMAAFDEESDDDAGVPVRPTIKSASTTQSANAMRTIDASRDEEQDSDEEDEPVFKPRGRLAARMGGAAPPIQEESSSEDEDVYQKVRRDLMASKKAPSTEKSPVKVTESVETARTQTPQPSPPRKRLVHRASTPAASARSESPGLFMSPAPEQRQSINDKSNNSSDSDSDLPADPSTSTRLRDLVNRRRAERLAREQAEKEAEEDNAATGQAPLSDMFNDEDTRDEVTERRLTQSARPTRKASKKALEEMNRETQRIKRNMQLTHQAKVKKRFTPQDFLSAFNRPKTSSGLANVTNAADVTSSSPPPEPFSETGATKDRDTPPSSPPSIDDTLKTILEQPVGIAALEESDEDLPTLQEVLSQPKKTLDKGKAPVRQLPVEEKSIPIRKVRVKIPTHNKLNRSLDDDDDDLEIIHDPLAILNQIPKTQTPEGRTMLMLRHLAQLTGNGDRIRSKKGQKPSISPQQLDLQLRQRAREIANQERAARLADLRAKGIVVLTEEEREREQMQIEDMLGKAREEADKLRKQEKATAKANGEDVGLSSDESEDGDYLGSDEEAQAPAEEEDAEDEEDIELSGSEEEDTVDHDMIDAEAGEEDQDEPEEAEDEEPQDDGPQLPKSRRARRKHVIEDDEDEEDAPATQQTSDDGINDELAAAFGFGRAPAAPMGMSQMFAGTMDDTQASDMISQDQDSLEMLRHLPPSAPMPSMQFLDDSQDAVADSQIDATQTQANEPTQQMDLQFPRPSAGSPAVMSQFSQIPDPSQDVGFDPNLTPLADRVRAPSSTVDTVLLDVPESPVVPRRGRLMRRSEAVQQPDEEDDVPSSAPAAVEKLSDAFSVMRQAAKKPAQPDFDKQKSNAKGMVDEQAEESEDEYRGLGGASDDEDAGSGDEDDKQMIDETDIKVNERELAALYAEKSREENEAQTSKLYKDLMSGNLRRKRGNNAFELDSDEDDQVVERRRRRQREEARKRKLLLQDETLGKLGSNDKKEAFLRAIEDRDEADDIDFLDGHDVDDDAEMVDSQQQPSASQPTASQTGNEEQSNSLKRSADSFELSQSSQQGQPLQKKKSVAASSLRRSGLSDTFRKPKSLAEVRDSLSFLIDDPSNAELASEILLSSDEEREVRALSSEPRAPASARRIPAKDSIIDRLTLKKQASSMAETAESSNLAFSSLSQQAKGLKPASLLRKATTNTSFTNGSFSNENRAPIALNREGSSGIRNGGSKKSSINYQAREAERQEIVQKAAKRREENVRKIAGLRRKAGGALGALGRVGGGFE
jgi:mediator of replication checkpoint protein 1